MIPFGFEYFNRSRSVGRRRISWIQRGERKARRTKQWMRVLTMGRWMFEMSWDSQLWWGRGTFYLKLNQIVHFYMHVEARSWMQRFIFLDISCSLCVYTDSWTVQFNFRSKHYSINACLLLSLLKKKQGKKKKREKPVVRLTSSIVRDWVKIVFYPFVFFRQKYRWLET